MEYQIENKNCQNCKNDFTIEPDDFSFYEKMKVPPPTFCPECRRARRWGWRNHMSLYSSKCDLCSNSIVSLYAPDSGVVVYCNKCWWSDKWDAKSYGTDYDFTKPFFTQFHELMQKVPQMALVNDNGIASVNCEYTHDWWFAKNCYMAFSGWYVENVMYSYFILSGRDIMDCMTIRSKNEWIYECIVCSNSYNLKYSQNSNACIDSIFLTDCTNCQNCFMCFGLKNKKYFFKNEKYTKEEYEEILKSYRLDTYSGVESARVEYKEFVLLQPRRFVYVYHTVNFTGDAISWSKNLRHCFMAKKSENSKFSDFVSVKDTYDTTMTGEASLCYEGAIVDHSQNNLFGLFSVKSNDIAYTMHCHSSKYLFASIALKSSSFCILNKQYKKEEYYEMVEKIKKHMDDMPYIDKSGISYKYGEFFPLEMSFFGYNETYAMEENPISKEEALLKGYKWQDNLQRTTGKETLLTKDIPESINDVNEGILEEVLSCIECDRNFKIVQNELIFYKKLLIPIPRKCFYCRHKDRVSRRNPYKLWHRKCMKEGCTNEFETSYAPERPEIVYCEKCYQQEFY